MLPLLNNNNNSLGNTKIELFLSILTQMTTQFSIYPRFLYVFTQLFYKVEPKPQRNIQRSLSDKESKKKSKWLKSFRNLKRRSQRIRKKEDYSAPSGKIYPHHIGPTTIKNEFFCFYKRPRAVDIGLKGRL